MSTTSKTVILTTLLAITGAASAQPNENDWNKPGVNNQPPVAAPEIDPASAISGMTLLLGGLAVIRGRRGGR